MPNKWDDEPVLPTEVLVVMAKFKSWPDEWIRRWVSNCNRKDQREATDSKRHWHYYINDPISCSQARRVKLEGEDHVYPQRTRASRKSRR